MPNLPLQGQCIAVMARRELRIEFDSAAEEGPRGLVLIRSVVVEVPKPSLVGFPRIQPFQWLAQDALLLGICQRGLDDPGDTRRDLILNGKDIADVAIVTPGPNMAA